MDTEEGEGLREEVGDEVRYCWVGQEANLKGCGEGDWARAGMKGGGNPQVHFGRQFLDFQFASEGVNDGVVEGFPLFVSLELSFFHFSSPGEEGAKEVEVDALGVNGLSDASCREHHFHSFLRQALGHAGSTGIDVH